MSRPRSTERSFFRFCPVCATPLNRAERDGMTRPTCPACGFVQYRNPVVGVAAIMVLGIVNLFGIEPAAAIAAEALVR